MFRIGLSSSAFLASSPDEVVARAKTLGFEGVEWAGAPHLGAGDQAAAERVMLATLKSGLTVVSYSPLYRVVPGGGRGISFEALLGTARAIYAPVIRVYAEEQSKSSPANDRKAFVDELRRLGDLAGEHGITMALSPNPRSVLGGLREAVSAVEEAAHPFVRIAWEPVPDDPQGYDLEILEAAPELFSILRPRAVDKDGKSVGLESDSSYWARIIGAFSAKPGPRDIGRFVLLGGIGDCRDETLSADMAFARRAASTPQVMDRG
ncbi:MAG TPA: TIM barrel protein [Rectinemataceae bacterium]|nr:TIM barrel protein [Rectinemataceae bacterium]